MSHGAKHQQKMARKSIAVPIQSSPNVENLAFFFAKGPKDLLMRMADRTENLEDGETRLFQGGRLVTCHEG